MTNDKFQPLNYGNMVDANASSLPPAQSKNSNVTTTQGPMDPDKATKAFLK
jgi:hypothetical protein